MARKRISLNGTYWALLTVLIMFSSLLAYGSSEVPEHASTPITGPHVLPSEKFFGPASIGYAAAAESPEICSKLFCYCGCDMTDSHSSLLDCFTSDHGVDCKICQDEALTARRLKKEGKSISEIQDAIDQSFLFHYPWGKPTDALLKYRASLPENAPGRNIQTPVSVNSGNPNKSIKKDADCCSH